MPLSPSQSSILWLLCHRLYTKNVLTFKNHVAAANKRQPELITLTSAIWKTAAHCKRGPQFPQDNISEDVEFSEPKQTMMRELSEALLRRSELLAEAKRSFRVKRQIERIEVEGKG